MAPVRGVNHNQKLYGTAEALPFQTLVGEDVRSSVSSVRKMQ
jgi:hypothetical protein